MVLWNEKIKKSDGVIRAVTNELLKLTVSVDGVVDYFNDGKEQGILLKIYDKYNPSLDVCFWVYLPQDRSTDNELQVIMGKHSNCNKISMWYGEDLKIETFTNSIAREMHRACRDYIMQEIVDHLNRTYDIGVVKV